MVMVADTDEVSGGGNEIGEGGRVTEALARAHLFIYQDWYKHMKDGLEPLRSNKPDSIPGFSPVLWRLASKADHSRASRHTANSITALQATRDAVN